MGFFVEIFNLVVFQFIFLEIDSVLKGLGSDALQNVFGVDDIDKNNASCCGSLILGTMK